MYNKRLSALLWRGEETGAGYQSPKNEIVKCDTFSLSIRVASTDPRIFAY